MTKFKPQPIILDEDERISGCWTYERTDLFFRQRIIEEKNKDYYMIFLNGKKQDYLIYATEDDVQNMFDCFVYGIASYC